MASIRAIDQASVHRIHAGQVVLDLQGAIKELVENALDAGATNIDVRIKNQGLDSVEVIDNGSGIAETDWSFIALKHHTSKLPSLDDLPHVTTFGFRGEAMSSLCALCESVTVVTATKETEPMGAIIQLARDGKVIESSGRVARMRGTTVTLNGLFIPLPVRRKEFERTIKREFPKALTLLQAYALVPAAKSDSDGTPGVRLKVETVSSDKKAKRTTMLSTDGRGLLRSSVISVWGPKALEGVMDLGLELDVPVDPAMARREGLETTSQAVKVTGLISSAGWGQGRSSADRQFYYINGRPCDLKQVGKAINEVYRSFNTHQLPLAVIDFQLPPESIDINVSPDKRTIFLHSEANLIAALRAELENFFAPSRSAYALEGASKTIKTIETQSQLPFTGSQAAVADSAIVIHVADDLDVDPDQAEEEASESDGIPPEIPAPAARADTQFEMGEAESGPSRPQSLRISGSKAQPIIFEGEIDSTPPSKSSRHSRSTRRSSPPPSPARGVAHRTISTSMASWSSDKKSHSSSSRSRTSGRTLRDKLAGYASQGTAPIRVDSSGEERADEDVHGQSAMEVESGESEQEAEDEAEIPTPPLSRVSGGQRAREPETDSDSPRSHPQRPDFSVSQEDPDDGDEIGEQLGPPVSDSRQSPHLTSSRPPRKRQTTPLSDKSELAGLQAGRGEAPASPHSSTISRNGSGYRDEVTSTALQGEATLRFDLTRLRNRQKILRQSQSNSAPKDAFSTLAEGSVVAAAGIQNRDSHHAEEALARVISKHDFARMEVLGQFNKGFIIARLRSDPKGKRKADDLFIIDQHACDEKYNFETLQRTTVIKAQTLIRPRPLQLTAGDEIVAVENLDILRANGFEVAVDEGKAPGRGERISLSAMPVSKETTFDFKDLEQLLHMLSDGARPAGQMVRCRKARSMFAMRACRKSVMIGKSLTKPQMVQLVRNMGTIDQPWNCPHGRPTMRHLTKIEPSKQSRAGEGRIDWTKWDAYHE